MKYYITDSNGKVRAKFDGVDVDIVDGHEINEVESVDELSSINVDERHSKYEQ